MKLASYLNVGDLITYGKYKNAKGRITAFGMDEKGNPTVTVKTVHKDPNKKPQTKTMGLFKRDFASA